MHVLIQERRSLVREGIASILAVDDGLVIAGCAVDDEELLAMAATRTVDVVVLELHSEDWDVSSLVAQLGDLRPGIRTVAMHHGRRSDEARHAKKVGVAAQVSYGAGRRALVAAVRGGKSHPSPVLERRTLPSREVLTAREREVLRHIAAGLTTAESALLLDVSPKTVDNHKQRIFGKLGVRNQAHAVALAHRMGIFRGQAMRRSG